MLRFLKIYLLPGAILQSVMIGGGYGTGRELVEFFTRHGMGNGLIGMLASTALISVIFALTLALSNKFKAHDYRTFFKVLLGPGWFTFEILGVLMFVVVLAVMGAAAGEIIYQQFGIPAIVGGIVMLAAVVTLNFFGREWVTRILALWSVLLYSVFFVYFVVVVGGLESDDIGGKFAWEFETGWVTSSLQYALYNAAGIPIILYAAREIETQRQAVSAGLVGGVIAMFPGILFHLSFTGTYPTVLEQDLPVYFMFENLNVPLLQACYLLVLFGTFIETGAGNMQGFIERLDTWWRERTGAALNRLNHATVAAIALSLSGALSVFGIVDLIAEGYGTLAWGYLFVYLIPLFTVGIWRLAK